MNKNELAKLLYGYKITQCLYVAAKLGISDYLKQKSHHISELAKTTSTDENALYRVLRCLATLGIYEEKSNKVFSINTPAEMLCSDSNNSLKDFTILCGEDLYDATGYLLNSVITGKPSFDELNGKSFWESIEEDPEKSYKFHAAMEKGSSTVVEEIIRHYNFSSFKKIVDVGGGKGHLVCSILKQNPLSEGIVFDLPNAIKLAKEYISGHQISNRCTALPGNFFVSVPSGNALILKVVLHDWDDESSSLILNNCRKSLAKNGKLIIIEKILDENDHKELACLGDINMLVTVTGKERTIREFDSLLRSSELEITRVIATNTVFSIIEAIST